MALATYKSLSLYDRALVALAVLVDGAEAETYLACGATGEGALNQAANELASLPPETRMPLVGSLLRSCLESLRRERS
jgi:hypothetical protein